MKRIFISLLALLSLSITAYTQSFNFTVAPSACANQSPDGTCLGTQVFDWTVTFDNIAAGQRLDFPTQVSLFNDPSLNTPFNSNYVYTANNQPCTTYDGTTDGSGNACEPAPTVALQIVADGETGNGLQVLADDGLCGYGVNGLGVPHFGIQFGPTFNTIVVQWDEMWRPGFDLHSEGKIGILTTFQDPSLPIYYGPEQMWFNCSANNCASPTSSFNDVLLNMGDYGTSNPRHTVVEEQDTAGSPWPWSLGTWYHFRAEIALGPNGWYKNWINGVMYNNYPPGPINGAVGQVVAGGPSTTDAITTTTPAPLAAGNRGIAIVPHFGGQPDQTTWAVGSGDCMRTNSYIVYDNIHVTAYNR